MISQKTQNSSKHTVYLTSYMRPEMTQRSIESVLQWENLDSLVIIIDGLRTSADLPEIKWRNQTIQVSESIASTNSNVELWVYSDNIGITNHTKRIQGRALEQGNSGIWLEEDIELDLETYAGILNQLSISESTLPILTSAFSHSNHFSNNNELVKANLFLPLWGMAFNQAFYELFCKVWHDKRFEESVVEKTLQSFFCDRTFQDRLHKDRVIKYWKNYLSWGFINQNRWDAVANYALWSQSSYGFTTMTRLAEDLSYMDDRGMNQRVPPQKVRTHQYRKRTLNGYEFCVDCEIQGSRIDRSIVKRAQYSITYRVSKFL